MAVPEIVEKKGVQSRYSKWRDEYKTTTRDTKMKGYALTPRVIDKTVFRRAMKPQVRSVRSQIRRALSSHDGGHCR